MTKSILLRSCASTAIAGFMMIASAAHAAPSETVVDGNEGGGYVVTDAAPSGPSNPTVVKSTAAPTVVAMKGASAASVGQNVTVGAQDTQTIFSNFATRGGDGSGGGAGLGGVFFVDAGRALTLSNVTFRNNTAEGGVGGVGSVGGSMNGLVSPGTAATGQNGSNSDVGFANFDGGKGGPGYAGYNGANASLGVGGQGGKGGAGSNGLAVTADTVLETLNVAYDTAKSIKSIKEGSDLVEIAAQMTALSAAAAAGANAGGPTTAALAPMFALLATKFTEMAASEVFDSKEEFARLAADTTYMIAMTITAYQVGASGVGGDGGSGGAGGDGTRFFSGGAGGDGGYGGYAVGTSGAVGGGGGSGGSGGVSGFGAGGASGGSAGSGGDSGSAGGVGGAYFDGDAGEGGEAGFGAGVGSDGSDAGGGGGSGYGGALFVAKGGTLNIVRNALFTDNYVLGGSSSNGGEAGEAVGSDLFIMKGSNVNLLPGVGNTIRFEGSIADDSAASIGGASYRSGDGASIQIGGGGLVQFAGENTYTGTTFISGATLEADIGAGIHFDSRVTFNGAGTIGGTGSAALSNSTAGVLLTSGEIVRRVGTVLPNQVSWNGSGGFAAGDDGLSLNFGKTASSVGQTLGWASNGFVGNGSTLIFGSEYGTGVVTLVNKVDLRTLQGRIAVYDNEESDGDWAVMAGQFSNGRLEVNDTGYTGALYFTNQNNLSGLIVHNGTVSTQIDGKTGRLMDATSGGYLTVTGGLVDLYSPERLTTVDVYEAGTVYSHSDVVTGVINNAGRITVEGASSTGAINNSGSILLSGPAGVGNVFNSGQIAAAGSLTTGNISNSGVIDASVSLTAGNIDNSGRLVVRAGPTIAGNLYNAATGNLQLFGGSTLNSVTNAGNLALGGATSVADFTNVAGGSVYLDGDLTSAGVVNNAEGGKFYLAGNISSGSTVTNDGLMVIVGNITNAVEQAAARKIITAGFQDPTGVVDLGGLNGRVANTLIVDQSGDSIYSGRIIGPGFFEKLGVGTLNLTGTNSFTGGLTVRAGTIDTTGGGTFADTLDVSIALGARLTLGTRDEVRSVANAGTLTANAQLTVTSLANSGTATMNQGFAARGNVSNAAGSSLAFVAGYDAAITGSLTNAGNLVSGGRLSVAGAVSNASNSTITMQAGGSNNFASLTNNGNITAAAAVTVTGGFVQNAGTVSATAGLNTGSLSGAGGAIAIGSSTFTVNQTVDGNYAGSIAGAGNVVKNGAATLTLSGVSGSFAPANLAIQQGAVAINGAGILDNALSVSVSSGAALTLIAGNQTIRNLSGAGTLALNANNLILAQGGSFSGAITGSGNVQVSTGAFTVASALTSTAATSVLANSTLNIASTGTFNAPTVNVIGTMDVQGSVNSTTNNVTGVLHLGNSTGTTRGSLVSTTTNVNGGGLLNGVGSITGLTVVGNGSIGRLRPGNSPGEMTFGNLLLDNNSITEMEIEGSAGAGLAAGFDRVNVTGTLKLVNGSVLQIANSNAFELALGEKIKIFNFQPGAVSGQFGSVSNQFSRAVAYNLATGSVVGLGALTSSSFESTAVVTANDRAMFNGLRVSSNGGVNQYYGGRFVEHVSAALASGNSKAVSDAFAKASPEDYTGLDMHLRASMLDNRLKLGGYNSVDTPTYFATGSFNYNSERNDNKLGDSRYKSSGRHVNIGAAAQFPFGMVQISYGRADGNLNGDYLRSEVTGDQVSVGFSAPVAIDGALRFQSRFAYGDYSIEGKRGTNAGVAEFSNVGGSSLIYGGGFEYLKHGKTLSVAATVELLAGLTKIDNFMETGASALENLNVGNQRNSFVMLASNLEVAYQVAPSAQLLFTLGLDQDIDDKLQAVTASVENEATSFTVANHGLTSTRVKVGIGTRINISENIAWNAEANIGNASLYSYKTGLTVRF
jgi:fibronectin-binding autotransporter adhesin